MVEEEDAARAVSVRGAEPVHINALRAAMHRVRPRIAGAPDDFLGLDDLYDLGRPRIGLGVEHVNARGAQTGDDEIAPLDVRMRRVGAQRRAAGVPAEVVQFVSGLRHVDPADKLGIGRGPRVEIDDAKRIRLVASHVQDRHVAELLRRGLHGHARRWIEGGIRGPGRHGVPPS